MTLTFHEPDTTDTSLITGRNPRPRPHATGPNSETLIVEYKPDGLWKGALIASALSAPFWYALYTATGFLA
jgi:hypothetical protein